MKYGNNNGLKEKIKMKPYYEDEREWYDKIIDNIDEKDGDEE